MEPFRFFTPVQVRYVETDMQGHVFFGNYFTYFDIALVEYLKAVGFEYSEFINNGLDFFYIQADCQFKDRAFFDETLHVHATVNNIGNSSFTFEFGVYEETTGRLIATGHIVAVTIDMSTKKPVSVPERFRQAVAEFEKN